jgi:hypothetical protein
MCHFNTKFSYNREFYSDIDTGLQVDTSDLKQLTNYNGTETPPVQNCDNFSMKSSLFIANLPCLSVYCLLYNRCYSENISFI